MPTALVSTHRRSVRIQSTERFGELAEVEEEEASPPWPPPPPPVPSCASMSPATVKKLPVTILHSSGLSCRSNEQRAGWHQHRIK